MKFQKTLLAASLAVVAVSTVNAADQWAGKDLHQYNQAGNANWVGLSPDSSSTVPQTWSQYNHTIQSDKAGNYLGTTGNQINTAGEGINAQLNNYYAPALSQNFHLNNGSTGQTGETHAIDLGSKLPSLVDGTGSVDPRTSIAKFKINNGTKEIVQIRKYVAGSNTPVVTYYNVNANNLQELSSSDLSAVQSQLTNENMIGGVITGWSGTNGTLEEIKRVNNETIKYGQIATTNTEAQITFNAINPNPGASSEPETFNLNTKGQQTENSVELGILAQKTLGNVTTNVYGVSAREGAGVATLTGAGLQTKNIVLANGDIQSVDGRVVLAAQLTPTGAEKNQHVREYHIGGEQVFAITDIETNEVKYYKGKSVNGVVTSLNEFATNEDFFINQPLYAGGTSKTATGIYKTSSVRNVVNDKNLTYSEKTEQYDTVATIGNTTLEGATGAVTQINTAGEQKNKTSIEQSVVTGIIGKDDKAGNVYGVEVKKSSTDAEGKTTAAKTTITADYVDSGDFRINGVSIVDNIKDSVDSAVEGASEAIDAKVAEVDQKIIEVDSRLTQFNTDAAKINGRVDQLNSKINDVEKTAYRGVAIALAAQQQIPNIGAGQFAVFGGVGHYEGETAGAIGIANVFADGRTSLSAALGVAGGNEIGGRVGVSYVFGGK